MQEKYVLIIGGANIDITGFSANPLVMEDSNPGSVKISSGGVGRNIAENLSKLGVHVKFLTVFGDDPYSSFLRETCTSNNIDIKDALIIPKKLSSVYLSIINNDGDMKLALCDGELLDKLNIDFLKTKSSLLANASIIMIDTNLSTEAIAYICENYNQIPIFADGVSTQKALKLLPFLNYINTVKLNYIEAEALSKVSVSDENYSALADYFISKGITNVYITLGSKGVYYGNPSLHITKPAPKVKVINATGAGDAFMAGLIYGHFNDANIEEIVVIGIAASILALSHENTINPNFSIKNIMNLIKELKIC